MNTNTQNKYLTSTLGYGMLRAIVKYYKPDDEIKKRAEFYLDKSQPLTEKLWWKKTEGSFFSNVLDGNVYGAISRGDQSLRKAICQALIENEI